ncbi:MAG: amino acid ABC transporter substrate-binding protein [Alphaproteobacteria bacterium]
MHMRKLGVGLVAAAAMTMASAPAVSKVEGNTIYLGSAISLTGRYSTNGIHTQNGYELAAQLINDAGGVEVGGESYQIEIVYYDDESTPARGAQLAERLISQDGIQFMLGPYSSGLTKAIAPVTEQHGVPMVEAEGASRSLFTQGYRYLFAVLSTSEQYLASAIALAAAQAEAEGRDPSELTVALAFENDPFSQDVRAGVMEDAASFGMQIVIDDSLPADLSDMTPTLIKVQAVQPDLLIISGHSKGATTAARQIGEMGISVPMIAMTHCDAAKITENFPAASEGILCATQWSPTLTYSDELFGSAQDFSDLFQATYEGYEAGVPYQAAQAAAAVMVFADAFERAQSFDQDAVRDALSATDMMTFYGGIRFSEAGNNIAKPMVLWQIQDNQYQVVAPPEWASHELVYPRVAGE